MTYNPNIPLSTDIPSQSQNDFLTNFSQLNTIFGTDHYAFNYATVPLQGLHQATTFEQRAAGPATTATQVALYSKAAGAATNLFVRKPSSGTEVQLTANVDPSVGTTGRTFLPGGLILQWGQATITPGLPLPFSTPFPNACLFAMVGPFLIAASAAAQPYVITWDPATVTFGRAVGVGAVSVTYIAIGN